MHRSADDPGRRPKMNNRETGIDPTPAPGTTCTVDTAEELRHLHRLEVEIEAAFPDLAADKVRTTVEQTWLGFLYAPVRDFVPLLVRRQAVDELRRLASR
jgi:hypothetical protein